MRFCRHLVWIFGIGLFLSGCGGSSSTSGSQATDTVFPSDLGVDSPTATTTTSSAPDVEGSTAKAGPKFAAVRRYTSAATRINGLLSGTTPFLSLFSPADFFMTEKDAKCFGPKLKFTNHPDGTSSTMTELPTGDVGIWTETDAATGHACAAAQLTSRMEGVRGRLNMALTGLAGLLRALYNAGGVLPSAGSSVSVTMPSLPSITFTTASIALDSSATTYTYILKFTYTDASSLAHNIEITLQHAPGASKFAYNGLMVYSVTQQVTGGNCISGGAADVTVIGSLKYSRSSAKAMKVTHRSGQFCGKGGTSLASYESDGELDPTYRGTVLPKPPTGWADDFSRFGADYNPLTLAGSYLYGWQAGPLDPNARILQLRLNPPEDASEPVAVSKDGEAYYGYGAPIHTSTGDITGFICNWAGPGSTRTLQAYAQRQFVSFNSTSGLWTQPTGGSDIRYGPTNSCFCTYASGFRYDRNLNSTDDELPTEIDVISGSTTSPLDLMDTTIGTTTYATIQEAILGRGYTKPSNGF